MNLRKKKQRNVLLYCALAMLVIAKGKLIQASEFIDVSIPWLEDNTTFYVGGDFNVTAYLNGKIDNSVEWSVRDLDGISGAVTLQASGAEATLYAKKEGRGEVIASTSDGSYYMRHVVVTVKNYGSEMFPSQFSTSQMTPVSSRMSSSSVRRLQIKIKDSLTTANGRIEALEEYCNQLAQLGKLTLQSVDSTHGKYEFYRMNIAGVSGNQIEVRIDKNDIAYSSLKSILNNLEDYPKVQATSTPTIAPTQIPTQTPTEAPTAVQTSTPTSNPQSTSTAVPTNSPMDSPIDQSESTSEVTPSNTPTVTPTVLPDQTPSVESKDEEVSQDISQDITKDITQGVPGIDIITGSGTKEDPWQLQVNPSYSSAQKIRAMQEYLYRLKENLGPIYVREQEEDDDKKIYGITFDQNDVYIEFIVLKDDRIAYEGIVELMEGTVIKSMNEEIEEIKEMKLKDRKMPQVIALSVEEEAPVETGDIEEYEELELKSEAKLALTAMVGIPILATLVLLRFKREQD